MKGLITVSLLALLSGCAAEHGGVRCNARLEPINTPAPRVTATPAAQGPIEGITP